MRHRRHVFVCVQRRDGGGRPACGDRGGAELLGRIEALVIAEGDARVGATGTQCLGPCFDGPTAVVYPDGVWYGELGTENAEAVVGHLVRGVVIEAKRHPWSDEDEA